MDNNKLLKALVFIPTSACGCSTSGFMDRIFKAILPYRDIVKMEVKDINSPEADRYIIHQNSIILLEHSSGSILSKFTSGNALKIYLEEFFTKKKTT